MVQPYNYAIQTPSAFESLVSGLKLGTSLQEMQAQQQLKEAQTLQIQQKLAEEQRRRERMAELNKIAPNELSSRLGEFSDVLPHEMFNALRNYATTVDEKTLRNKAGQLGQMVMAAGSNDPDVLESVGQELMSAAPDEPSKKAISAYLASAKRNPKQFVLGQSIVLRQLGDVGVKIADSIAEQLSLKPGAKDVLRKQAADADEAVSKAQSAKATARTAEETEAANLQLAKANAKKAQVQAEYERSQQVADLEKKAKDLGLSDAQTRQALAMANKLSAETQKATIELEALKKSGGVDPAKKFEQEKTLRGEYQNRTKLFNELDSTFSNLQSSAKAGTGPGDIALITGFMKMLDPGSVVRETEFATARDTAGLAARLENLLTKLQSGEFLKPAQRQEYVNLAKQYYDAAKQKADQERRSLDVVVKNYKLNRENVFGVEPEPASSGASTTPSAGATPTAPVTQSFTRPAQTPPVSAPTPGAAQSNVQVNY